MSAVMGSEGIDFLPKVWEGIEGAEGIRSAWMQQHSCVEMLGPIMHHAAINLFLPTSPDLRLRPVLRPGQRAQQDQQQPVRHRHPPAAGDPQGQRGQLRGGRVRVLGAHVAGVGKGVEGQGAPSWLSLRC